MSRILFDAFDVTSAAASIATDGTITAATSAATIGAIGHIAATGTVTAAVSASEIAVTGEGLLEHHEAPAPRLFYAAAARRHPLVAPIKDPGDVLDYTMLWEGVLEDGETISVSTWAATVGDDALTIGTGSLAATSGDDSATLWLSVGTAGAKYTLTNHITTSHSPPREYERSFTLQVADL